MNEKSKQIEIEQYCDGWTVRVDGKSFRWDHNDGDMGAEGIKQLLEYLGHEVSVEECY
jgi:hypothetical protein